MRFQHYKHADKKQYMAFGDEKDGTLFLWELPTNLKVSQPDELENIETFWDREIKKCLFVVEQRETKKEDWAIAKAEDEKRKALAEAAKDISEEQLMQKEEDQESAYQDLLLVYKHKFNMISDEELQAL
jgi:hypothetical protein